MTRNNELYEDFDNESDMEPGRKKTKNRSFIAALGILGFVVVLFVVVMVLIVPMIQKTMGAKDITEDELLNAQNTVTAMAATQLALGIQDESEILSSEGLSSDGLQLGDSATPTPVMIKVTETPDPALRAGVVDSIGEELPDVGINRTATIAALLTQAAVGYTGAGASTVVVYPNVTVLPNTGFIDEVGLPGMIGMAVVLMAVVFFVRRFRLPGN